MAEIESFYAAMGQRIQKARFEKGLTQEKLGGLLSPPVTRASIANIEAGKQRVLAHTLWQLAAALSLQVSDLVQGEGRPDGSRRVVERELARSRIPKATIRRVASLIGSSQSRGE